MGGQQSLADWEYANRKRKTKRDEFLEIMEEVIPWDEWTDLVEPYYNAAMKLLTEGLDFDGLFASNDLSAVGAMQALIKSGKKIPDDIALIGFDNTYVTSLTTPSISTIDVPKQHLGEEAGTAIIKAIETGENVEKIELPLTFIARRSTEQRTR